MSNLDSYPPFFRPNDTLDHGDSIKTQTPTQNSSESADSSCFPVIDFELMTHQKLQLSQICKDLGMFRLVNHGVPQNLLSQLHQVANKLFHLTFDTKQTLFTDPILYFWGSPVITISGNANQTDPDCLNNINWLEGFNVPLALVNQYHYQDPLHESFRTLLQEYGNHQSRLAKAIFSAMADDLNLSPKKSDSYLSLPTGFLRVYRYLRCPLADQMWGIDAHTDSSVLSILHQDDVGGLQIYKDGEWLDAKPIPNTLIVNIGDMMQAMSDDTYVSAKHRVKVHKKKERVSIGYFVFPDGDAVVESSNYKPFTYTDFQAAKELDVRTLGKKIGLPRFRITDH